MKLLKSTGIVSEIWQIFIADSSSATGAGKTGLAFNTASLIAYYHRDTDVGATAITLVTMTSGTYTSGGFVEIDATHMPGHYQFCPPNAALAAGAKSVMIHLQGAANMAPLPIEVQLTAINVDTATTFVGIKKNVAIAAFPFRMTDSTTHLPKTGLTVTATRRLDSGSFAACANAVSEVANGWYSIDLAATDTNGNTVALSFTATGADALGMSFVTGA